MNHDRIQVEVKNSPSIKLLRSDNGPLILSFLYQQFKQSHRVVMPYLELVEKLEDYLEGLREYHPTLYRRTAQAYLKSWADEQHQFLRRYYEAGSDDPVYELTPETEKVIGWLEELNKSEFVGTESRFLRVFSLLEDITNKSGQDVEARLAQLEKQKGEIERQIERIKETGEIESYTTTQIKERFFEANDVARRLLADFRQVEHNFRELARRVQENQLKEGIHKGAIVADVLNAEKALQESDQGRSFYMFWKFLMSPSKQEELRELLDAVYQMSELDGTEQESHVLRRIKSSLIDAGGKIVQSNQRLAEQLRRLLDEQNIVEARRVRELIGDIKKIAVTLVDEPPEDDEYNEFIWLEGTPEVSLLMEKRLWEPPEVPNFEHETMSIGHVELSTTELAGLYNQFYVDKQELGKRINTMLETRSQVSLAELSQEYPIEKGLSEIIAYFSLATEDQRHLIDASQQEEIKYEVDHANGTKTKTRLRLPRIVFNGVAV